MSFSIRHNPFTAPMNSASKRAPIVIDGDSIVETAHKPSSKSSNNAHTYSIHKPDRIIDVRPEKDEEQLIGAQRIQRPRSLIDAFTPSAINSNKLGSSIDVFV